VGAHTIGLCTTRYVLATEPLASIDPPALVDITGSTIQRLLTGTLPDT